MRAGRTERHCSVDVTNKQDAIGANQSQTFEVQLFASSGLRSNIIHLIPKTKTSFHLVPDIPWYPSTSLVLVFYTSIGSEGLFCLAFVLRVLTLRVSRVARCGTNQRTNTVVWCGHGSKQTNRVR
jgi:hypothetical protein